MITKQGNVVPISAQGWNHFRAWWVDVFGFFMTCWRVDVWEVFRCSCVHVFMLWKTRLTRSLRHSVFVIPCSIFLSVFRFFLVCWRVDVLACWCMRGVQVFVCSCCEKPVLLVHFDIRCSVFLIRYSVCVQVFKCSCVQVRLWCVGVLMCWCMRGVQVFVVFMLWKTRLTRSLRHSVFVIPCSIFLSLFRCSSVRVFRFFYGVLACWGVRVFMCSCCEKPV
jgi:hypothetical protein